MVQHNVLLNSNFLLRNNWVKGPRGWQHVTLPNIVTRYHIHKMEQWWAPKTFVLKHLHNDPQCVDGVPSLLIRATVAPYESEAFDKDQASCSKSAVLSR